MTCEILAVIAVCILYVLFIVFEKIFRIKRIKHVETAKLSPIRRWMRRWGFALDWVAVSIFVYGGLSSLQSYIYYGSVPPRVLYYKHVESAFQKLADEQKSFHKKYGRYAQDFKELGWSPSEWSRRYSYFTKMCYTRVEIGERTVSQLPSGLTADVSKDEFTVLALADIDGDAEADVWRLAQPDRIEHLYDDLKQKPGDAFLMTFGITALCLMIPSIWVNKRYLESNRLK